MQVVLDKGPLNGVCMYVAVLCGKTNLIQIALLKSSIVCLSDTDQDAFRGLTHVAQRTVY